jgi:para-aminobenzoate synthetase component 1
LLHDGATNQWWRVGESAGLPQLQGLRARGREVLSWRCAGLTSVQGRGHYEAAVARTVEYTRAGDVFQANIAHQLRTGFEGSARGLFARLLESARPRHGACVELGDGRTVCSMSPELFLDANFATGTVRTRPIKGTRPVARADELRASEKDGAELVMIVDLMRNDLGRVCRFGSVRVDRARVIERHGPIVHGVGSVSGVMREGTSVEALMRAAFPAGSVTGAPKVRAMQIIQELEGFRRGAYCGSVGFVSRCGRSVWNVGIRTATIVGDELVYPVGAGIVEGSDPAMEWEETLHKAEGFAKVLREGEAGVGRSRVVTSGVVVGTEGVR